MAIFFSNLALGKVIFLISHCRPTRNTSVSKQDNSRFEMLLIYLIACLAIARADDKPVLQEIFVPRKLIENQNIKLHCDLVQGSKPVRFGWFFNDEPIRESERLQIEARADSSSLMIMSLSGDSVGQYKCVGTNDQGSDQQTVTVNVNSKRTLIWIFLFTNQTNWPHFHS